MISRTECSSHAEDTWVPKCLQNPGPGLGFQPICDFRKSPLNWHLHNFILDHCVTCENCGVRCDEDPFWYGEDEGITKALTDSRVRCLRNHPGDKCNIPCLVEGTFEATCGCDGVWHGPVGDSCSYWTSANDFDTPSSNNMGTSSNDKSTSAQATHTSFSLMILMSGPFVSFAGSFML